MAGDEHLDTQPQAPEGEETPPRGSGQAQHLRRPEPVVRGRWQATAIERSADVALSAMPVPLRMLDVGCADGSLLREMVARVPYCDAYVGIDPAPGAIVEARQNSDLRISFVNARPEALPFADAEFDLVVSSLSFAGWRDQRGGVEEMARVVSDTGTVVLVDAAARWMRSRGRVRSPKSVERLLTDAGLEVQRVETVVRKTVLPLVRAFIACP